MINIICCVIWGFLFISDIVMATWCDEKMIPAIRLILAEGVVFIMYLAASLTK